MKRTFEKMVGAIRARIKWFGAGLRAYFAVDVQPGDVMSFSAPPAIRAKLSELKQALGLTEDATVIRRALALLEMAVAVEKNGESIAISGTDGMRIVNVTSMVMNGKENLDDSTPDSPPALPSTATSV